MVIQRSLTHSKRVSCSSLPPLLLSVTSSFVRGQAEVRTFFFDREDGRVFQYSGWATRVAFFFFFKETANH